MNTIERFYEWLMRNAHRYEPNEDFRHNVYGVLRLILNIFYVFWYAVFIVFHLCLAALGLVILITFAIIETIFDGVFD